MARASTSWVPALSQITWGPSPGGQGLAEGVVIRPEVGLVKGQVLPSSGGVLDLGEVAVKNPGPGLP